MAPRAPAITRPAATAMRERRLAALAAEQRRDAQRAQRGLHVLLGERRQQHGAVLERLDVLAAVAHDDHGAEDGVHARAHHELAPGLARGGHDHAVAARAHRIHLGPEAFEQPGGLLARLHAQGHKAVLGLVRHVGRAGLDDRGRADGVERGARFVGRAAQAQGHGGHAVMRQ